MRRLQQRWKAGENDAEELTCVGLAYLEADMANCPQWNLEWFERFMSDTDKIVQELLDISAQRDAASKGNTSAVQGLGGAPPGAGPPQGAPPGMPPASRPAAGVRFPPSRAACGSSR